MSLHIPPAHQAERQPLGQPLLVLLAAALVTSGACLWVVSQAPDAGRAIVAWSCGVAAALLSVACTVAAYARQSANHFRDRAAAAAREVARLADDTLPALVHRLREGVSADTALAELPPAANDAHQRILRTLADEIGRGERMRAAAMSACANAAGRVQALATSMLADLREMEQRHGEEVLGDLLKLDHSTAQAGRLADSIAVLTGARSGRRWTKPIVMESILRGAVGRISAYQRVRLHSTSTVAVAGYAAEGVMHALAELMDNATRFSPPSDEVHVYVEEVHAGVVVTVEDGGLVMSPAALRRAERAVSAEPLDLTTLSGTRLGLAVVGCLARKHGLTVSFRPSSRGGTGVVVMIPRQLITQPRREPQPAAQQARQQTRPAAAPVPSADAAPAVAPAERTAGNLTPAEPRGLPKRQRGQALAAAPPSAFASAAPPGAPTAPRPNPGARFGAFRQATRGGATGATGVTDDTGATGVADDTGTARSEDENR